MSPLLIPVYVLLALGTVNVVAGAFGVDFYLRFKWFDLWVGAYVDRAKRTLYVCPLPCVVLVFERQVDADA